MHVCDLEPKQRAVVPPVLCLRLQALVGTSWLMWVHLFVGHCYKAGAGVRLSAGTCGKVNIYLDYPPVDNRDMNWDSNRGSMESVQKKMAILSCQS